MGDDIAWYVCTCHICQVHQTQQVLIPPVVVTPAPLFAKMYMDTMHLPRSGGYLYIVQGRCSLTGYLEFHMLHKETTQALSDWIFQDILCRWGTLVEIVSDNGKPFVTALGYLECKYHVKHIRISGYNLRTNGIVERSHFDVHQALFKAADGEQNHWLQATYSVFWSEHVTPQKHMGCLPFFTATSAHPLLPFDIMEANYLLPPPDSLLSTTDLIAQRAIALQKRQEDLSQLRAMVHKHCNCAAIRFEKEHLATIYNFKCGGLILVHNTAIEKALNCKMWPCYFGPMVVVSRNKGGAYIICKLDGTLLHSPIAAFRVVPYFAQDHINIPDLEQHLDISVECLRELEASTPAEPDGQEGQEEEGETKNIPPSEEAGNLPQPTQDLDDE